MWNNQGKAVILFITFIATFNKLSDSAPLDDEVRLTLLAEEWNHDLRVRRDAETNLPDHLSFGVPVRGNDVVLRLGRSRLLRTVTCDGPAVDAGGKAFQNAAVYTDPAAGSTVIVRMELGSYKLKGSFLHEEREWSLEPVQGTIYSTGESKKSLHRVFPVKAEDSLSLGTDAVKDSHERPEILRTEGGEGDNPWGVRAHQQYNELRADHHRQKRAAVRHVIDIAFVVDYSDFVKWEAFVGSSQAIAEMRLWYTYVGESINNRYETIKDPDIGISTTVTVLKIITTPQSATFISSLQNGSGEINGTEGLNSFLNWYPNQTDIPTSSHYMLFTGFNIRAAAGIAFSARVCTSSGLSICENSFTGSVSGVAAHELGHSLSAIHDTETTGVNSCTDTSQYVMAAVFRTPVRPENVGNPWRFSNCSIAAFKSYLAGVTCTLPGNSPKANVLPAPVANQRAGEVLDKDEQCRLSFRDQTSFFCQQVQESNGGLEMLCGGMYCRIPNNTRGFCQTTVPQEFTECGDDKWCVAGICINETDILDSISDSTANASNIQSTTTTVVTTSAPSSASNIQSTTTTAVTTSAPSLTTSANTSEDSNSTVPQDTLEPDNTTTTKSATETSTPQTDGQQDMITNNATPTTRRSVTQTTNRIIRTICPPITARVRTTPAATANQNRFSRCLTFLFQNDFQGYYACLWALTTNVNRGNITRG